MPHLNGIRRQKDSPTSAKGDLLYTLLPALFLRRADSSEPQSHLSYCNVPDLSPISLDLSDHIHATCLCNLTTSIYQNMECNIFPILFSLHANGKLVPFGHLQYLSLLRWRDGCHRHVPPPGAARQLHGDIWPAFSTGYGTKLKSSASQRALWCCSLRVADVSQNRSPYFFCGASPVGRCSWPSCGDSHFTAALIKRVWPLGRESRN
jgi:hypothetical protein